MMAIALLVCEILVLAAPTQGQSSETGAGNANHSRVLNTVLEQFDVTDAIARDVVSQLSLTNIEGLHLGFEEIIRNRIQTDPRHESQHFSIHLRRKTVREALDELCVSDLRYVWSEDGATINVYPRATTDDSSYLLNLRIERINLRDVDNPDHALTPLSRLFPAQQIGYFGPGLSDNTYAERWTTTLEHLTVRQFTNRIAEHMGPHTSWVWRGGKGERMFTFLKGGFQSRPQD